MSVFALGLNHTTAPVDLRGRFAVSVGQLVPTLQGFKQQLQGVPDLRNIFTSPSSAPPEVALLSTCNRTEIYCAAPSQMMKPTLEWLAHLGGVSVPDLQPHTYVLHGHEAARHAFRVASGLDSMVLGEPQILGQLKEAVREADTAGMLGTTLHQLFQRSFAVAKEVRTSTEIGVHSISMASAAVRLAGRLFEDLKDIRVLFVGAGEMIELCATHFAARTPRHMAVANRTLDRGEKLASRLGAEAIRLSDLSHRLHEFDAVISCTASSLPLIGLGAVERALKARRHRPMFMVDLAVPRDIEPEVARLDDVYLYTVDDLSTVVHQASEKRQAAVSQAEVIIETGVQSFVSWLHQRSTVPLIKALQVQTDEWREAELSRARKQLAKGADVDHVLESLSRGITQKLLHGTLAELHAVDAEQRSQLAEVVARLFLRGDVTPQANQLPTQNEATPFNDDDAVSRY